MTLSALAPSFKRPGKIYFFAGILLFCLGIVGLSAARKEFLEANIPRDATHESIDFTADLGTYLPGARVYNGSINIQDLSFEIVEQNGSPGQKNPPVSLGTHLETEGDLIVYASLSNIAKAASLRLYANPPIIQDEFRVEPAGIDISIQPNTLVVTIWNDANQEKHYSYKLDLLEHTELELIFTDQKVELYLNKKQIASIPSVNIFSSGKIWFGASSEGGDYTLSRLAARPINGGRIQRILSSEITINPADTDTIQGLARKNRSGFTIGAAMALGPMVADSEYRQIALNGNFGSITTENSLKWQFTEPMRGQYAFQETDALLALAEKHGMILHGHTLVFGEANPLWVTSLPYATEMEKNTIETVMVDHIRSIMGRYRGKIPTWDVVNEPLADYDHFKSEAVLRDSIWYRAMGEAYIKKAFQAARLADPEAKLFINEYGLEANGERWDTFLSLITRLKREGVPIDGVGFESHVYEASDKIDSETLASHMMQLADIGLMSRISEIDVYDDDGPEVQANQFRDVLMACINTPSCISWTTWGISDRYNMYKEDGSVKYGRDLLWDDGMQPTLALKTLLSTLNRSLDNRSQ